MSHEEALSILLTQALFGLDTPKPVYEKAYNTVVEAANRAKQIESQFGDMNGDNS